MHFTVSGTMLDFRTNHLIDMYNDEIDAKYANLNIGRLPSYEQFQKKSIELRKLLFSKRTKIGKFQDTQPILTISFKYRLDAISNMLKLMDMRKRLKLLSKVFKDIFQYEYYSVVYSDILIVEYKLLHAMLLKDLPDFYE